MNELKRTQLYDIHVACGGTMVDFGGWEMPVQYPSGIVAEHLFTRKNCSLFDVCHMGRLLIEGPERLAFLQKVLTSNAAKLTLNTAQYCIISDETGSAIDDAYLHIFEEDSYLLVVNASNTDKDLEHLMKVVKDYDCTITNITSTWGAIAVQGPKSEEYMKVLSGGAELTAPKRNALNTVSLEGRKAWVAKTGYTGEPVGYEVYMTSEDTVWLWNRLCELGAKPAGLGARDTLRIEAGMPLYGHEMGLDAEGKPMPIFAVPLAKFAVSFVEEKGDFIGREALAAQSDAFKKMKDGDYSGMDVLPKSIRPIALMDRGVIRNGMPVYRGEEQVGWITSGTMIPYYCFDGEGENAVMTEETGKRSIGMCYVSSDIKAGDNVEVDVRGRKLKAVIPGRHMDASFAPYVQPVLASGK